MVYPIVRPKPGITLRRRTLITVSTLLSARLWLVNLVEDAAVTEMRRLRLFPSAAHCVDGEKLHLGKIRAGLGRRRQSRSEVMLGRDRLPFRRIEIFEIGLGDLGSTVTRRDLVDQRDGRFGLDA